MDNTREKLIELLTEAEEHAVDFCVGQRCEDCTARKYGIDCRKYLQADHLIANGVTIATDNNVGDKLTPTADKSSAVAYKSSVTNADRIRAMSDEELAVWIARTQIGAIKDVKDLLRLPYDTTDRVIEIGKAEALEWLKQPAED